MRNLNMRFADTASRHMFEKTRWLIGRNTMNTHALIADLPAEHLLGLGILFFIAALCLLLLSTEAGNYPEFSRNWRNLRTIFRWHRPRRRWYYNMPRRDDGKADPIA